MDLILKDCREIYLSQGRTEKGKSIHIQDELIHAIDSYDTILQNIQSGHQTQLETIDCSALIVIPGFVDSHTHLLFSGTREEELYMRAAGQPYLEILKKGGGIHQTVEAVQRASEEELIRSGLSYLDHALGFGITTIEVKSGYGLDYEAEKKMLKVINQLNASHAVDIIPTFLVHTVPLHTPRDVFLNDVSQRMIPEFGSYAQWFDLFLEKGVFDAAESERLIRTAMDYHYHVGIHTNQVHDIGGVKLAEYLNLRHVDHLEILSDDDAERIRKNNALYAVFLPTAEGFVFSEHMGQINKLLDCPERLVISSDFNPGSSPVLNPYFVMAYAVLRYRLSDPALLMDMYTLNPAEMLYLNDRGRVQPGMRADLTLLQLDNYRQIPYMGTFQTVRQVIKNGRAQLT